MKTITLKEMYNLLGETLKAETINQNHTVIHYENGSTLWSYKTLVAAYINNDHYFTKWHDYSVTTSKWVNKYCGYDTQTRRAMLKEELATLINY